MTQISIRIEDVLKDAVLIEAKKMWISLSWLTKLFYRSFLKNKDILKIDIDEVLQSFDVSNKKWKKECLDYFKNI